MPPPMATHPADPNNNPESNVNETRLDFDALLQQLLVECEKLDPQTFRGLWSYVDEHVTEVREDK